MKAWFIGFVAFANVFGDTILRPAHDREIGNITGQHKTSGEERLKRTVHHIIAILLEDPEPPLPMHRMPLLGHQIELPKDMVYVPKYPAPEIPKGHYPEYTHSLHSPQQMYYDQVYHSTPHSTENILLRQHHLSSPQSQVSFPGDSYAKPSQYSNPPSADYYEPSSPQYIEPPPLPQYAEPSPVPSLEEYSLPTPALYSEPSPSKYIEPTPEPRPHYADPLPLLPLEPLSSEYSDAFLPEHSEPSPQEYDISQQTEHDMHIPSNFPDDNEENEAINPVADHQGEIPAVFSNTGHGRKPSHPPENLVDLYPKMPGDGYPQFSIPNIHTDSTGAQIMQPQHDATYEPPVFEPEPIIHQSPEIPNPPPETLNGIPHKAPFSYVETLDKQTYFMEPILYSYIPDNKEKLLDDHAANSYDQFRLNPTSESTNIPNPILKDHNEEHQQLKAVSEFVSQPLHNDGSLSNQQEISSFSPHSQISLPNDNLFFPNGGKSSEFYTHDVHMPFVEPEQKPPESVTEVYSEDEVLHSPVDIKHDNPTKNEMQQSFQVPIEQMNSPNDALHVHYHDDAEDTFLDLAPKPTDPDNNHYPDQIHAVPENEAEFHSAMSFGLKEYEPLLDDSDKEHGIKLFAHELRPNAHQEADPYDDNQEHGTHIPQLELPQHIHLGHEMPLPVQNVHQEPEHHLMTQKDILKDAQQEPHFPYSEQHTANFVETLKNTMQPIVGGYETKPLIHVNSPHHPDSQMVQYHDDAEDIFLDFAPHPINPYKFVPPLPDNQQHLSPYLDSNLETDSSHKQISKPELHQPQPEMQFMPIQTAHHKPHGMQHIQHQPETQLLIPDFHHMPIKYAMPEDAGRNFEDQNTPHFSKEHESSHNLLPEGLGSIKSHFSEIHHTSDETFHQPYGIPHESHQIAATPHKQGDINHSEQSFGNPTDGHQSSPVNNHEAELLQNDQHSTYKELEHGDKLYSLQATPLIQPPSTLHHAPTLHPIPIPVHSNEHRQPMKMERPLPEQYENEEHHYPQPILPNAYHQELPIYQPSAVPLVILAEPVLGDKPHTHSTLKNLQTINFPSSNNDEIRHDTQYQYVPNYSQSTHSGYSVHVDHPSPKLYMENSPPLYESGYVDEPLQKPQAPIQHEGAKQVHKPEAAHHSGYEVHVQHDHVQQNHHTHQSDLHHKDYKLNPVLANGYTVHVQHEAHIHDPLPSVNYQQYPLKVNQYGSRTQNETPNEPSKQQKELPIRQSNYEVHVAQGQQHQSKPSLHHLSYDINVQHGGLYNTNSDAEYNVPSIAAVQNPSYHVHMEQQIENSYTPPQLYNRRQDNNRLEHRMESHKPSSLPITNAGNAGRTPVSASNSQHNHQKPYKTFAAQHVKTTNTPKNTNLGVVSSDAAIMKNAESNSDQNYELSDLNHQQKKEDPWINAMKIQDFKKASELGLFHSNIQVNPHSSIHNPNSPMENQFLGKPVILIYHQPNMITSAYQILHQYDQLTEYRMSQHPLYQNNISIYDGTPIPGSPGIDYPEFSHQPATTFQCDVKLPGFFADVASRCQAWHYCDLDGRKESFLCPNGTLFHQKHLHCDWWYNVECHEAEHYFQKNALLCKVITQAHQRRKANSSHTQLKKSDITSSSSLKPAEVHKHAN